MARKRRFDDGGEVREGRHSGIDDETRARAMEYVRRKLAGEQEPEAASERTRPAAPAPRTIRPARPSFSGEMPREQFEAINRMSPEELRRRERAEAIESVAPEMMLPPGRLMRGLQGLGAAAARRVAPELNVVRGAEVPRLAGPPAAPRLTGPSSPPGLPGSPTVPRLPAPESARTRTGTIRRRKAEPKEREAPRDVEEARMADEGGPNFRKGGAIKKYASGGSVSASRRADGIAQRGKTRGKVY